MKKTGKRLVGLATVVLLITVALVGVGAAGPTTVTDQVSLQNALNSNPDGAKLAQDITLSGTITVTAKTGLDLNGFVLTGSGSESVIMIDSSGDLTLTDSNPGAVHKFTGDSSGQWIRDDSNGTKTVNGGVITGGKAPKGGGIQNNGTLTMNGGTIFGNSALSSGGGIYNTSTFTMNGGTVSDNTAASNLTISYGGGIYNTSIFTMNGGTVSNNTAGTDKNFPGYGGGIFNTTTFTMNGGTISDNKAIYGDGGGTYNYETMLMSSGTISGNTAYYNGGGVLTREKFTMTGGEITKNKASGIDATGKGGGVSYSGEINITNKNFVHDNTPDNIWQRTIVVDTVSDFQRAIEVGGHITLGTDLPSLTVETQLAINTEVTLDLNGYNIFLSNFDTGHRFLNINSGGSFVLEDSKGGGHIYSNDKYTGDGGVIHVKKNGSFTMNGGYIHNFWSNYGGAVYVEDGGTFTMNDGLIAYCMADDDDLFTCSKGGAVYVKGSGTFTMNGGSIQYCMSDHDGGAVFVDDKGTFTMNGGSIKKCNTLKQDGGAVYICDNGTFTMKNGTIEDCFADNCGGAVYVKGSGTCTITGGKISDCNTTDDSGGAVYLNTESACTLSGITISGCYSYKDGGAIYLNKGNCTITGVKISNCFTKGTDGDGGAIYLNDKAQCTVSGTSIKECHAVRDGGAERCILMTRGVLI